MNRNQRTCRREHRDKHWTRTTTGHRCEECGTVWKRRYGKRPGWFMRLWWRLIDMDSAFEREVIRRKGGI